MIDSYLDFDVKVKSYKPGIIFRWYVYIPPKMPAMVSEYIIHFWTAHTRGRVKQYLNYALHLLGQFLDLITAAEHFGIDKISILNLGVQQELQWAPFSL